MLPPPRRRAWSWPCLVTCCSLYCACLRTRDAMKNIHSPLGQGRRDLKTWLCVNANGVFLDHCNVEPASNQLRGLCSSSQCLQTQRQPMLRILLQFLQTSFVWQCYRRFVMTVITPGAPFNHNYSFTLAFNRVEALLTKCMRVLPLSRLLVPFSLQISDRAFNTVARCADCARRRRQLRLVSLGDTNLKTGLWCITHLRDLTFAGWELSPCKPDFGASSWAPLQLHMASNWKDDIDDIDAGNGIVFQFFDIGDNFAMLWRRFRSPGSIIQN